MEFLKSKTFLKKNKKMPKEIAISVNSLSKTYKLYEAKRDFIKEALHPFRKIYHTKFHALQDISFTVEKGEVLGIIGKNGSGKSTLLKILASVVTQTSGKYSCNGRVTALLELSGGFNKELTGIENIKFLGALQGYSKGEMDDRIIQILDFAEIGEYVNQPVKSYSSGMYMRLAFSLAINIDPDILIIDEILAVGDSKFKLKCLQKIQEFKEEGKTIVICTHSMSTVNDFCTRAIWIHKGKVIEQGSPESVIEYYNSINILPKAANNQKKPSHKKREDVLPQSLNNLPKTYDEIVWYDMTHYESFGTDVHSILYASAVYAESNKNIKRLKGGDKIKVLLYASIKENHGEYGIHLLLKGNSGSLIFKINSNAYKQAVIFDNSKHGIISIEFVFPKIGNGRYTMSVGMSLLENKSKQYFHWVHDALIINVSNPDKIYNMGTPIIIEKAKIQIQAAKLRVD